MTCTAERAKELLRYDHQTGMFWWRNKSGTRRMTVPVGNVIKTGYRYIAIDGKRYRAHRLAWLVFYGDWPELELDHINGERDDNRITNLRQVTRKHNLARRVQYGKKNAHGLRGVRLSRHKTRWRAQIKIDGKTRSLGSYATAQEAADAYAKAAKDVYGSLLD